MLFAYAFARSEVRFSFKVIKSKNEKSTWSYAPATSASTLAEAASKIVGTEVASQLITITSGSEGQLAQCSTTGHKLEALVIRPGSGMLDIKPFVSQLTESDLQKACNTEQFISVDNRPVSTEKDLMKNLIKTYKNMLRNLRPPDHTFTIPKPFLCLRVSCPPQSYDVNVEPAKDRLMSYNPSVVSDAFKEMLATLYGEPKPSQERPLQSSKAPASILTPQSFDLLLARKPVSAPGAEQPLSVTERSGTILPGHGGEHGVSIQSESDCSAVDVDNADDGPDSSNNPWSKAKMNVRLSPTKSMHVPDIDPGHSRAGSTVNQIIHETLELPLTPIQAVLGPMTQLLTPALSTGSTSPYQNPGPPPPRRTPRTEVDEETPPPTDTRSTQKTSLLEDWIQAGGRPLAHHLGPDLNGSQAAGPRDIRTTNEAMDTTANRLTEARSVSNGPLNDFGIQQKLISPFRRPRPSQFPASQDGISLTRDHPRASSHLTRRDAIVGEGSRQELDDILQFERQKKAISQQRKDALRAMRAGRINEDIVPHCNASGNTEHSLSEGLSRLPEASSREDFGSRFEEQRPVPALASGQTSRLPNDDPRACLMRQRKLQDENQQFNTAGFTRTGLKVRRIKSAQLPLETIPVGAELFSYAIVLDHQVKDAEQTDTALSLNIRENAGVLKDVDEYMKHGSIGTVRWVTNGKDVSKWEQALTGIINAKYQHMQQPAAEITPPDFTMSLGKAIKAHVDEHGN